MHSAARMKAGAACGAGCISGSHACLLPPACTSQLHRLPASQISPLPKMHTSIRRNRAGHCIVIRQSAMQATSHARLCSGARVGARAWSKATLLTAAHAWAHAREGMPGSLIKNSTYRMACTGGKRCPLPQLSSRQRPAPACPVSSCLRPLQFCQAAATSKASAPALRRAFAFALVGNCLVEVWCIRHGCVPVRRSG